MHSGPLDNSSACSRRAARRSTSGTTPCWVLSKRSPTTRRRGNLSVRGWLADPAHNGPPTVGGVREWQARRDGRAVGRSPRRRRGHEGTGHAAKRLHGAGARLQPRRPSGPPRLRNHGPGRGQRTFVPGARPVVSGGRLPVGRTTGNASVAEAHKQNVPVRPGAVTGFVDKWVQNGTDDCVSVGGWATNPTVQRSDARRHLRRRPISGSRAPDTAHATDVAAALKDDRAITSGYAACVPVSQIERARRIRVVGISAGGRKRPAPGGDVSRRPGVRRQAVVVRSSGPPLHRQGLEGHGFMRSSSSATHSPRPTSCWCGLRRSTPSRRNRVNSPPV